MSRTAGERLRLLEPGTALRLYYQNDEGVETAASGLLVGTGETVVLRTASAEGGILRVPLASVRDHRLISAGGPSHRSVGMRVKHGLVVSMLLTMAAGILNLFTWNSPLGPFALMALWAAPLAGFILGWVRSPWETPITVQLYSWPLIRFRFERNEGAEEKRWP